MFCWILEEITLSSHFFVVPAFVIFNKFQSIEKSVLKKNCAASICL